MGAWSTWLESQVADSAPNRSLDLGTAAQRMRALADACAAIERRSGIVYGVSFDEVLHAEMFPVLSQIHSMLAEWGTVSEQVFGAEGQQVFADVWRQGSAILASREKAAQRIDGARDRRARANVAEA